MVVGRSVGRSVGPGGEVRHYSTTKSYVCVSRPDVNLACQRFECELNLLGLTSALSEQDPYLWVTEAGEFHLLYHRMNDGQQTGGHGFSADGHTWTWGPPAYDASVRYEDPVIGRRWFASRERPHLVWERPLSAHGPGGKAELEPIALTTGVKVCDFRVSSVEECNMNSWPGYQDASFTSVQPIRSTRYR